MPLLGVDTGGTFTDFVLITNIDEQNSEKTTGIQVHKLLSTPKAPEQAILQGISELGLSKNKDLVVVHGSTVATNAVLAIKMSTRYEHARTYAPIILKGGTSGTSAS